MMDETTNEILSRHLDGDLDSEEEKELAARLEAEPALVAELEAMRRIRGTVASLAANERAPAELDALVEPLLRGRPETVTIRPWARWLATAAAIVLGATVIIEVNRRNPEPSIESLARLSDKSPQAEPTERFSLAPLPTSPLPPERQPLGASDRLLASPIPEVELDEPPPLVVLGPLDEEETVTGDELKSIRSEQDATEVAAADAGAKKSRRKDLPDPKAEKSGRERPSERDQEITAQGSSRSAGLRSWDAAPPMGRAKLFVFIDGKSAWREFTPASTCKPGRYSVRIVVANGAVREARPVGGAASATPSQRLCAADLILDLEIAEVADGEYPAEVVVEPRGAGK